MRICRSRQGILGSITSTRPETSAGCVVVGPGNWQHRQPASQPVVVTDVFPGVSPPYFPIFRGYLHGLWAEWANVGLAICHRLEPMQWTVLLPLAILSSIDPVQLTFVNIIISGRGCWVLLSSSLPFSHILDLVTLKHSTNTKKWGYFQKITPPLIDRINIKSLPSLSHKKECGGCCTKARKLNIKILLLMKDLFLPRF